MFGMNGLRHTLPVTTNQRLVKAPCSSANSTKLPCELDSKLSLCMVSIKSCRLRKLAKHHLCMNYAEVYYN